MSKPKKKSPRDPRDFLQFSVIKVEPIELPRFATSVGSIVRSPSDGFRVIQHMSRAF
jgi:hypothetical protein